MREEHGLSKTAEYRNWQGMLRRCTTPTNPHYGYYGGRGITVCERWRHSFTTFLADMGHRPTMKHSIDRIDPNGHYAPENCRWATSHVQRMNRRGLRLYNGYAVSDLAKITGLPLQVLYSRMKHNWPFGLAIELPCGARISGPLWRRWLTAHGFQPRRHQTKSI